VLYVVEGTLVEEKGDGGHHLLWKRGTFACLQNLLPEHTDQLNHSIVKVH